MLCLQAAAAAAVGRWGPRVGPGPAGAAGGLPAQREPRARIPAALRSEQGRVARAQGRAQGRTRAPASGKKSPPGGGGVKNVRIRQPVSFQVGSASVPVHRKHPQTAADAFLCAGDRMSSLLVPVSAGPLVPVLEDGRTCGRPEDSRRPPAAVLPAIPVFIPVIFVGWPVFFKADENWVLFAENLFVCLCASGLRLQRLPPPSPLQEIQVELKSWMKQAGGGGRQPFMLLFFHFIVQHFFNGLNNLYVLCDF